MNKSNENPKNQIIKKIKNMSDNQITSVLGFLVGMDVEDKPAT